MNSHEIKQAPEHRQRKKKKYPQKINKRGNKNENHKKKRQLHRRYADRYVR